MLVSILGVLIGASLFILFLGYKYDFIIQMLGYLFLFLIGIAILTGVTYETGAEINHTYTYTGSQVTGSTDHINTHFGNYDTQRLGIFLSVVSFLGFAYSFIDYRRTNKNET